MNADIVPFLELKPAYDELKEEIDGAIAQSLASGWYIGGHDVDSFESEFAAYVGAKHCVGVGNGLDALSLALLAHDVGPGDEVIIPSHTFIATWLSVSRIGAQIVSAEPLRSTMNVDPDRIESAISSKTKAIVPVHLYGQPAAMQAINEIANRRGIVVIEDAAQAHGATLAGKRIGSFGTSCCWSFYPGKNLGAMGDAGAVTSDDDEFIDRVRALGNYGSRQKYVHELPGINSRLDPVQAAVLRVKLTVLEQWNQRRAEIAQRYRTAFQETPLELQDTASESVSSNHLFVVRCPQRDRLASLLGEQGIKTLIHYPIACRDQGAYRECDLPETPLASELAAQVLSLPIGPQLRYDQVTRVIEAVLSSLDTLH